MPKQAIQRIIDSRRTGLRQLQAQINVVAPVDHGGLLGLADDDHAQYLLASSATSRAAFAANWTDLTDGGNTTLHTHTSLVSRAAPTYAYSSKADNYTLDATDAVVALSVAGKTLTLPTASGCAGRRYTLKATQTSGTIVVATTSSQTIDGQATQTLSAGDCFEVVSNGSNWEIV